MMATTIFRACTTLVAALAGAASVSVAQASVTLYGIIDTGFNYQKRSGESNVGIDSGLMSNSRWGLRGSEDLGNGTKAFFVLESGFSSDTGQSASKDSFFNRFSLLGFENKDYGKVTLGRGDVLIPTWIAGTASPFSLNFKTASLGTTFGYNDTYMAGGRVSDALYYYSPEYKGWQLGAGYSWNMFGLENQFKDNSRLVDLAIKYENGPYRSVVGYQIVSSPLSDKKDHTFIAAARYNFEIFTLHAGYQKVNHLSRINGYNGAVATKRQFTGDMAWTTGVSVPLASGLLYAGYQHAIDSKARGAAVAYSYPLSKRTNVYTYYSRSQSWNFDEDKRLPTTQIAVGIRHRF